MTNGEYVSYTVKELFDQIDAKLDRISLRLDREYVSKEEFKPIKAVVYGMVALVMISVVGALISLVVTM